MLRTKRRRRRLVLRDINHSRQRSKTLGDKERPAIKRHISITLESSSESPYIWNKMSRQMAGARLGFGSGVTRVVADSPLLIAEPCTISGVVDAAYRTTSCLPSASGDQAQRPLHSNQGLPMLQIVLETWKARQTLEGMTQPGRRKGTRLLWHLSVARNTALQGRRKLALCCLAL